MKYKIISLVSCLLLLGLTISCNNAKKENTKKDSVKNDSLTVKKEPVINTDEIVAKIDKKRTEIEGLNIKPVEVKTNNLREKIKQKWSKIHYYVQDGKIVRIKTYSHPNISKRTEEFYIDNNTLILAVIEDNGEGNKGKSKEKLDKMYYFENEKLIKENKSTSEKEFSVKNSDGEEILSEYKEYLDIFKEQKK
jgi:hypothetical protein